MNTVEVTRQRDAHGAYCETCDQTFSADRSPYWHWSKAVAAHKYGTGHAVRLFAIVTESEARVLDGNR